MARRLRLHETLFYDCDQVKRCAHEGILYRKHHLDKIWALLKKLIKTDPLEAEKKCLCKYLLTASMGPKASVSRGINRKMYVRWPPQGHPSACGDNRAHYRDEFA